MTDGDPVDVDRVVHELCREAAQLTSYKTLHVALKQSMALVAANCPLEDYDNDSDVGDTIYQIGQAIGHMAARLELDPKGFSPSGAVENVEEERALQTESDRTPDCSWCFEPLQEGFTFGFKEPYTGPTADGHAEHMTEVALVAAEKKKQIAQEAARFGCHVDACDHTKAGALWDMLDVGDKDLIFGEEAMKLLRLFQLAGPQVIAAYKTKVHEIFGEQAEAEWDEARRAHNTAALQVDFDKGCLSPHGPIHTPHTTQQRRLPDGSHRRHHTRRTGGTRRDCGLALDPRHEMVPRAYG